MTNMPMNFDRALDAACMGLGAAMRAVPVADGEVEAAAERMRRCGYEHGERSIAALRAYLEGKSLMLSGTVGTGKTLFFAALNRSGVARSPIAVYSLKEHDNDPMDEVVEEIRGLAGREVLLDDVGSEHDRVEFGNRPDVLASIMSLREASPRRTHYTTNLVAGHLRQRYGSRVVSRFRLCARFAFVGKDRRCAAVNCAEVQFRLKCASPESWALCRERCPLFADGKCGKGISVPPMVRGMTPEAACGVGDRLPYSERYLKGEEELQELRRALRAQYGMA